MKIYSDGLKCSFVKEDITEGVTFEIFINDEYKPVLDGLGGIDKVILHDLIVSHNMFNYLDNSEGEALLGHKLNKKGENVGSEGYYFNQGECLTEEEIERIKHSKLFNKNIETIIKE